MEDTVVSVVLSEAVVVSFSEVVVTSVVVSADELVEVSFLSELSVFFLSPQLHIEADIAQTAAAAMIFEIGVICLSLKQYINIITPKGK